MITFEKLLGLLNKKEQKGGVIRGAEGMIRAGEGVSKGGDGVIQADEGVIGVRQDF